MPWPRQLSLLASSLVFSVESSEELTSSSCFGCITRAPNCSGSGFLGLRARLWPHGRNPSRSFLSKSLRQPGRFPALVESHLPLLQLRSVNGIVVRAAEPSNWSQATTQMPWLDNFSLGSSSAFSADCRCMTLRYRGSRGFHVLSIIPAAASAVAIAASSVKVFAPSSVDSSVFESHLR
jgi:hypothetical protein